MKTSFTWLRKAGLYVWKEFGGIILFVCFVFIPVRSSLADWNVVPTGSMNPTILEGDLVYVNKAAYDIRLPLTLKRLKHRSDPQRGDICVFFSPVDHTRLVKRVVAVPGDTIEMKDNVLSINGRPLQYSELAKNVVGELATDLQQASVFAEERHGNRSHAVMQTPVLLSNVRSFPEMAVPAGHYFIMGDNRDNSLDSRHFGPVERRLIIGKATAVIGSLDILENYTPRLQRFFQPLE